MKEQPHQPEGIPPALAAEPARNMTDAELAD